MAVALLHFGPVGLALILLIAALSLIGVFLDQVPREIATQPGGYAWWVENIARPRFGYWTGTLSFLRLFDVFHSPWFLAVGGLLVVNIAVCSLNRLKYIGTVLSGTRVKLNKGFYESGGENNGETLEMAFAPAVAASRLEDVLLDHKYRVRTESSPDGLHIAADKNRYFRLGTYAIHIGIILIIVGFLLSTYLGFRNTSFMVAEGATRDVGYNTGLSLQLTSFTDEYWPDGTPKDYRSDVVVYKAGQEVTSGTIRVNSPLNYQGIRFHQAFFGPAAMIQVQDPEGQMLYDETVPMPQVAQDGSFLRPVGDFELYGLSVYIVGTASGTSDPVISPQQLGLEFYQADTGMYVAWDILDLNMPKEVLGLNFTYTGDAQFSGFQVSRDPGNILIWIASGLFVVGLASVFYFPHRQIWALAQEEKGGSRVYLRTSSTRSFAARSEFEGLVKALDKRVSSRQKRMGDKGELR